jgi:hypothetical protein
VTWKFQQYEIVKADDGSEYVVLECRPGFWLKHPRSGFGVYWKPPAYLIAHTHHFGWVPAIHDREETELRCTTTGLFATVEAYG